MAAWWSGWPAPGRCSGWPRIRAPRVTVLTARTPARLVLRWTGGCNRPGAARTLDHSTWMPGAAHSTSGSSAAAG